ncbi:unnamed protein product [Symbiodinium sp. CCMP2456]|nr:unnamed protein product [Symbiodinium sp. CCMP2456]
MRVNTGLIYTKVEQGLTLICGWNSKWQRCKDMAEGITLQEAAAEWCAPVLTNLGVTAPCHGFNLAYIFGLICAMAIVLNFILLGAGIGMLLQYFNSSKHKPEYRQWAFCLHAIATSPGNGLACDVVELGPGKFHSLTFSKMPLLTVLPATTWQLTIGPVVKLGKSVLQHTEVSYGYCLMVAGILLQSWSAVLFSFMPLGDEMTEDERMLQKFAKEQAHLAALPGQPPAGAQAYYGSAPGPAPTATQQGYGYGYGYGAPQGKERCFYSCEVTALSLSTVRHWGFGRMAQACSSLCPQSAESKHQSGWFRCGVSIRPHKFAVECFAVGA